MQDTELLSVLRKRRRNITGGQPGNASD